MSLFLRALLAFVRVWPAARFDALARLVFVLARPFAGGEIRPLAGNVERIFGLRRGTNFANLFARQNLTHQVLCGLETLRAIQQPELIQVTGFDELQKKVAVAEAAGKGHLIVTAHVGSWELCAYYGRKAGNKPFHVLAKPSRSPAVTKVLDELRHRMGTPVLWTDKKTLVRDMLGALKRGESLGFVMDQKPEGRKGPVVNFFGLPTEFVSGPATMAIRTGAAVISIFCLREGPFRFRLFSEELVPANHGVKDEDALTQTMASAIERVIRLYPEQWTWNYRRWSLKAPLVQTPSA
jgi:KDO2-lipid IV(A) lauroyltransferase